MSSWYLGFEGGKQLRRWEVKKGGELTEKTGEGVGSRERFELLLVIEIAKHRVLLGFGLDLETEIDRRHALVNRRGREDVDV